MHPVSGIKILLFACCLIEATTICIKAAGPTGFEGSYLIRARPIEDIPEALAILRRFIARGPNELKCERYAVLLNSLTGSQVSQFSIAELGLASANTIRQKFRLIDVETLRQLYIDAINKFRGQHFDQSLLELMDCLSQKFRTIDAKARSFLNNKSLQELISQYRSIMDQPLDFLLDPDFKHPTLARNQVDPEIKQTLLDLFNGDAAQVESRFKPALEVNQLAKSSMTVVASPEVRDSNGAAGGEDLIVPAATTTTTSAMAVAMTTDAAAQPSLNNFAVTNLDPVDELDLTSDEQEYLADFLNSIHKLYNTLPLTAQLNDRCEAYANLTQADPISLKGNTVDEIVRIVNEKIASNGPNEKVYLPDASVRENFLFSLRALGRKKLSDQIWIDLVDCVSQWEQNDPEVEQFMRSEELAKAYEEILKTLEPIQEANDEQSLVAPSKDTSELPIKQEAQQDQQ